MANQSGGKIKRVVLRFDWAKIKFLRCFSSLLNGFSCCADSFFPCLRKYRIVFGSSIVFVKFDIEEGRERMRGCFKRRLGLKRGFISC